MKKYKHEQFFILVVFYIVYNKSICMFSTTILFLVYLLAHKLLSLIDYYCAGKLENLERLSQLFKSDVGTLKSLIRIFCSPL